MVYIKRKERYEMKIPKKLIAFGLSICMSIVPCVTLVAEDFTDAQPENKDFA